MSITRKETRHGRCPFCEFQTTKNDRINTDHVAIWCAKCGATMEIPQGKMSYNDALDTLYDRWYSRPIEGALQARMTEPTPLTPDAKFPCVVRLIQDDSQMGKYNKRLADGGRLPFVCNGIKENHIQKDGKSPYFEYAYECYEIIGYPVADGSAEWALYQMLQGDKVTKRHLKHTYWHYDTRPHLKCISEYNCGILQIMVSPDIWKKTADREGWQLYEEKPEPEPASSFEVGDWVEVNANGVKKQGKIMRFCEADFLQDNTNALVLHDVFDRWYGYHRVADITRKLPPSEVVVHIGCLSGPVRRSSSSHFCIICEDHWSMIAFAMLKDALTRNLVESLLNAQEESCHS